MDFPFVKKHQLMVVLNSENNACQIPAENFAESRRLSRGRWSRTEMFRWAWRNSNHEISMDAAKLRNRQIRKLNEKIYLFLFFGFVFQRQVFQRWKIILKRTLPKYIQKDFNMPVRKSNWLIPLVYFNWNCERRPILKNTSICSGKPVNTGWH